MKSLTIYDIEHAIEGNIKAIAAEHLTVKGHDVYLADLGDDWGYSALVYYAGQPIWHANEYAMHHQGLTQDELRKLYIQMLMDKLYRDAELARPLKSYADYRRRCDYLTNLYSQRKPHVSAFYIGDKAPETDGMIYDDVAYAWYDAADADYVGTHSALWQLTQMHWAAAKEDYTILCEAFEYEMDNHEYCINWSGDVEVLAALGFGRFSALTDLQRRAYAQAQECYLAQCGEY